MTMRDGALLRFKASDGSPHVAVYDTLVLADRDVAAIRKAQQDCIPILIYGVLLAEGSSVNAIACKCVYRSTGVDEHA